MNRAAARRKSSEARGTLYVALELAWKEWKLGLTPGLGQKPRVVSVPAGETAEVLTEIRRAKRRFGLAASTRVASCYEAGRDGFWIHRWLTKQGIENRVVDAGSIEVRRHRRRRKTDRLDATKLVTLLMRFEEGEESVWSVVAVPSESEEDQRHLARELLTLKQERTRQINRMKGLLAAHGLRLDPAQSQFLERLESARLWDGQRVPEGLRFRLQGEHERFLFIEGQIQEVHLERKQWLQESEEPSVETVRQLLRLRGIGIESAWLLTMELFAWRPYRNRRQAASLVGLTPTPYASGDSSRELGISKRGNRRVRWMLVQIAWCWIRLQPDSQLARWYRERFAGGGKRQRRIGSPPAANGNAASASWPWRASS